MKDEALQLLAEKFDHAASQLAQLGRLRLLPRNLQLLTPAQVMEIFQVKKNTLYKLKLPRYVHDGVVRYRVADLPEHITTHMQTADGHPLHQRAMRRREISGQRSAVSGQEKAA